MPSPRQGPLANNRGRTGEREAAVRGADDRVHRPVVFGEALEFPPRGDVPEAHGLVVAPREQPAVGTEGQAANRVLVPDQYIVVLDDAADAQTQARAAGRMYGVGLLHVYEHALKGFAFHGSAQAASAIEHSPHVEFVAPDQVVELVAQSLPTGIDRIDADLNPISHIDGIDQRVNVNVGIIDTGIDPTHPDLNVVGGANFLNGASFKNRPSCPPAAMFTVLFPEFRPLASVKKKDTCAVWLPGFTMATPVFTDPLTSA